MERNDREAEFICKAENGVRHVVNIRTRMDPIEGATVSGLIDGRYQFTEYAYADEHIFALEFEVENELVRMIDAGTIRS